MTLERFDDWADKNFPRDDYASAEDRLEAIEKRIISDGNVLHKNVRDELLSKWMEFYSPEYREAKRRHDEQLQIAEFLGNGEIPTSWTDEYIDHLNKPEIMGFDFTEFESTRTEYVEPPEIRTWTRQERTRGMITHAFKSIGRWIKGAFGG